MLALQHSRQCQLCQVGQSSYVDLKHLEFILKPGRGKRSISTEAGIVYQVVHLQASPGGFGEYFLRRFRAGKITGNYMDKDAMLALKLLGKLFQLGLVASGQNQIKFVCRKQFG